MLTARGDDVDRIVGLELGADDYVPKPCNPRELVARIRAILRRTQVPEPAGPSSGPLTAGALTLWPERRALEWRGEPLELTSTEFNLFEAEATGRHVEFVGAGEALVIANAELLHRALENVVRNAVKFTNEGTAVEVEITRHRDSNQLVVTVSDRGPGVPEAELQAIFEPFFRSETRAKTAGFGLGLAIARRAIETHGGTIRADNRPSGGLKIEIVLPAVAGG